MSAAREFEQLLQLREALRLGLHLGERDLVLVERGVDRMAVVGVVRRPLFDHMGTREARNREKLGSGSVRTRMRMCRVVCYVVSCHVMLYYVDMCFGS